jgi:hypothetical protein
LDAVLNDVTNLAVSEMLCLLGPQIGDTRIEACADVGSAAAVNTVANSASAEKKFAPLIQEFRRRRHGVLGDTLSARDRGITNRAGYRGFKVRRFRTRAEAALNNEN